jgi:EmrB/QacA subfamily drug resistance transporter
MAAIMGSFVATLDATVVNVALPAIERDLGGGLAGQQWVVNAYLLPLGSLILVGGSLGDVFGARRIFALGVGGFGAVSALCAIAPSIEVLVAARALQGAFGALLTPAALAVVISAFPPGERGAAIGSWTAWSGIAFLVGPLAGGQLVDVASWRWIFAVNVPFVIVTLALVFAAVPKPAAGERRGAVDWLGAVLCALGLGGPTYALIRQPELGWGDPGVLVPALGGIAVFAAFLAHERRTAHPMLPLALFRRRNFAAGNAETLLMYAGLAILQFFLVLFLQQVAGYSALDAGLALMPVTVVLFLLSKRAGRLADRYGPRPFMGCGPLVSAAGLALVTMRVDADIDYATDLLPGVLVFSLGLAATVAPLTATVLADADEHKAGIASGVNNAIARVAGLLAVAALGAVVATQFGTALDDRLAGRELGPPARAAVEQARERTIARAQVRGLPPDQARAVAQAAEGAAVESFRVAIGIATALLAAAGAIGLAAIRNPRREVRCEECPGGQFAGQPLDAAREREPEPVGAAL